MGDIFVSECPTSQKVSKSTVQIFILLSYRKYKLLTTIATVTNGNLTKHVLQLQIMSHISFASIFFNNTTLLEIKNPLSVALQFHMQGTL